jgi:hypothetical protein
MQDCARSASVPLTAPKSVDLMVPSGSTTTASINIGQSVGITEAEAVKEPMADRSAPVRVHVRDAEPPRLRNAAPNVTSRGMRTPQEAGSHCSVAALLPPPPPAGVTAASSDTPPLSTEATQEMTTRDWSGTPGQRFSQRCRVEAARESESVSADRGAEKSAGGAGSAATTRRPPPPSSALVAANAKGTGDGVGVGVGEIVGVAERLEPGDDVWLGESDLVGVSVCVGVPVRDLVPERVPVDVGVLVREAPTEVEAERDADGVRAWVLVAVPICDSDRDGDADEPALALWEAVSETPAGDCVLLKEREALSDTLPDADSESDALGESERDGVGDAELPWLRVWVGVGGGGGDVEGVTADERLAVGVGVEEGVQEEDTDGVCRGIDRTRGQKRSRIEANRGSKAAMQVSFQTSYKEPCPSIAYKS